MRAKFLAKHELPGIELEHPGNHLIVKVAKVFVLVPANVFYVDKLAGDACSARAIFEILNSAAILFAVFTARKMQQPVWRQIVQILKSINELFLDTIELIRSPWQDAGINIVL